MRLGWRIFSSVLVLNGCRSAPVSSVTQVPLKAGTKAPIDPNILRQQQMMGQIPFKPIKLEPGDTKVETGVYDKDGITVELEGVCRATDESVSCWDLDRRDKPLLAKEISDGLSATQAMQGRGLNMMVGKKNRLLVRKRSSQANQGMRFSPSAGSGFAGWTEQSGQVLSSQSTDFSGRTTYRDVLAGAFEKDTEIAAYRYVYSPNSADMISTAKSVAITRWADVDFKPNSTIKIGSESYHIGEVTKSARNMQAYLGDGKFKPIPQNQVTIKPESTTPQRIEITCQIIGADGRLLQWVDINGVPASQAKVDAWNREYSGPLSGKHTRPREFTQKFFNAMVNSSSNLSPQNEVAVTFSVDPKYIKKLRISINPYISLFFDNIPLDPR